MDLLPCCCKLLRDYDGGVRTLHNSYFFRSMCLLWLLLSANANMAETFEYAAVRSWSIRVDMTLDYGCYIYSKYEDGTEFRVGVDILKGSIYLLIGDSKWQAIEYQKKYEVQLKFGDEFKWTERAEGYSFYPPEDQPYLAISIDGSNENYLALFLKEFSQEANFQLFFNGTSIANLGLNGSDKALQKLYECQEEMDSIPHGDDLIEDSPEHTSDDPFDS